MTSRDIWIWLFTLFAVLVNAFIGSFTIEKISQAAEAIEEAHSRIGEFTLLISDIKDAETGQRGFVVTGDEEYLAPYFVSETDVPARILQLERITAHSPDQQQRLREIRQLYDIKLAEMKRVITVRNAEGFESARLIVMGGEGKSTMDALRLKINEAIAEENSLLRTQEVEARALNRTAHVIIIAAAVLAIGIVLAAASMVRSEFRRRMRAHDSLKAAKEQIETAYTNMRQSESLFRSLAESMPQKVWMCKPDGAAEYFNRRWYKYTGLTPEQCIGDGWLAALYPEDRERSAARWAHSILTGEPYEIEYRLVRHDGVVHWFLGRGTAARDEQGAIVRWLGTSTDIDDNKRLSENLERTVQERTAALTEQRTFLDAILNNVNEGIVACDSHGRLLFNRATQEMHGLEASALPVDEWAKHYSLYEADGVTPLPEEQIPLRRALKGEQVHDAEMIIRPVSGPERFLVCSGQPLVNSSGRTFGAVVSMRDMTARRAAELELQESARLLQASNEELEKFAYIASHDLQEPLRKIQAFGDRLGKKAREHLDADNQDSLNRILDASGRMRRLIDDLLAFSRVSTKTKPFELVNLNTVLAEVRSVFALRLEESQGRLHHGEMPQVLGDESQLRQLFQNLIGNAMKFARNGVPPEITITATPLSELPADAEPASELEDGWRITIRDNGIGFDQQYANRIFELFQRLHGRQQFEGTGLGLAISKKIVNRHGGTIQARGEPGHGATFIIDWPSRHESAR